MLRRSLLITLLLAPACAWAQDELVQMGKVATLAPLCGLRAEGWAFDLRRAELQQATGSRRFDDEALRAAPGRGQVEAALGYAESEALEDFAGSKPLEACGRLLSSPDLDRADEVVNAFRAQRRPAPGS